jgi:uncharacterized protein
MEHAVTTLCTAFEGFRCVASGELTEVALKVKASFACGGSEPVFIFDDATGRLIDVDFRGTDGDVLRRLAETTAHDTDATDSAAGVKQPRGPGRPRLGVVAREVTLLPRHWDWLNVQPGGASVALRRLVERAKRDNVDKDRARLSQEAANRFMGSLAGDLPGFEEATRALFAGNRARFDELVEPWPADVRDHAKKLAAAALATQPDA